MYVTRAKAARHYNVTGQTIVTWANNGSLDFKTIPSGQRRYRIDEDEQPRDSTKPKKRICYCRVSSSGQKDDLERQIEYMRQNYPGWTIMSDVGSGLNWNRKNLRTILQWSLQGDVEAIAIAHRDRMARFGFEIVEYMLAQRGVRIVCDSHDDHKSKEEELVDDIVSIITVFSSKIYGRRNYKNRKANKDEIYTTVPDSSAEKSS